MDSISEIIVAPHTGYLSNMKKLNKQISKGSILATINGKNVESPFSGKIVEICGDYKDNKVVAKGSIIARIELCKHPAIFSGLCISCGEKMGQKINMNNSRNNMNNNQATAFFLYIIRKVLSLWSF